jgi:hypothetical protein
MQAAMCISQHHRMGSGALDVQIIDPKGNPIPNRGADTTGLYKQLAEGTYREMQARYPELQGKLAWGGNFGTDGKNSIPDLMHFDIGGDRGHMGRLADFDKGGSTVAGKPGGRMSFNMPSRRAFKRLVPVYGS